MTTQNRAMYPASSRAPEIENVIKGNSKLMTQYEEYVLFNEENNRAFFDTFMIDTSKFKSKDKNRLDHDLNGAALPDIEGKKLIAYHLTDDHRVMETLTSGRSLVTKHKDRSQDIGPGFYASSWPEYWKGRSIKRYDPLMKLNKKQRARIVELITKSEIDIQGYLSPIEKEELSRALNRYIESGDLSNIYSVFNQPYNVQAEDLIQALGLKPYNPFLIKIEVKGKFFDIVNIKNSRFADLFDDIANAWFDTHYREMKGSINLGFVYHKFLNDFGFSGMFERAGMLSSPQIVVWKRQAIINAELTRASKLMPA